MPRPKTGGRKKGVPNKVTGSVKQAVFDTFCRLGGAAGMQKWAQSNQHTRTEFYKIAAKLIPAEITGAGGGAVVVQVVSYCDKPALPGGDAPPQEDARPLLPSIDEEKGE